MAEVDAVVDRYGLVFDKRHLPRPQLSLICADKPDIVAAFHERAVNQLVGEIEKEIRVLSGMNCDNQAGVATRGPNAKVTVQQSILQRAMNNVDFEFIDQAANLPAKFEVQPPFALKFMQCDVISAEVTLQVIARTVRQHVLVEDLCRKPIREDNQLGFCTGAKQSWNQEQNSLPGH
jgi:hypothetical protein